jgi:hypothetical protein
MREQIARQVYTDWMKGVTTGEPKWEDLPDYRKNTYREWVDEVVFSRLRGEIEKVKRLSDEEIDACTPTDEQLEKYLAEPDDEVAARIRALDPKIFRLIGRCLLYGKNIAQAQLTKTKEDLLKTLEGK